MSKVRVLKFFVVPAEFKTVGEIANKIVENLQKKLREQTLQSLGINDQIIISTSCKLDSTNRRKNHHE
ncbi:MAG: hypothetical protein LBF44_00280 [Holosporaceae bacterium]|jgi:hypothetical protein|nr:hypothetical protein [Holosporaceae bacterium]